MSIPRTKSLGRAVDLLHAVAARPGGSSGVELARATGLPRSTVTRTLRTLADLGLVEQPGAWVLGYELVRLARAADPYRALVEAARGVLARLRDEIGESALLAGTRGPTFRLGRARRRALLPLLQTSAAELGSVYTGRLVPPDMKSGGRAPRAG